MNSLNKNIKKLNKKNWKDKEATMSLYDEFEAKYINEELIEYFIIKRKHIIDTLKQEYLHQPVSHNCLVDDIYSVARMSFDAFHLYAKAMFENDYMIETYANEDKHTKDLLFSESNQLICCKVLNEITYTMELELN